MKSPTSGSAVIGNADRGPGEAMFLRSYTADVTLIDPDGPIDVSADDRKRLEDGRGDDGRRPGRR